jgi:hypothetical protein
MEANRKSDKEHLLATPKERLVNLLFLQMRNIWSEDGLYFLGIEKEFSTKAAIEIDREVWSVMGKLEARRLKNVLGTTGDDLPIMFEALKHTSWWLDLENKEYELEDTRALIRNTQCRVQLTRIKKGLSEFGCKPVRWGYLKSFVKEFNPNIKVNCKVCPPDKHPEGIWCEWEFILAE